MTYSQYSSLKICQFHIQRNSSPLLITLPSVTPLWHIASPPSGYQRGTYSNCLPCTWSWSTVTCLTMYVCVFICMYVTTSFHATSLKVTISGHIFWYNIIYNESTSRSSYQYIIPVWWPRCTLAWDWFQYVKDQDHIAQKCLQHHYTFLTFTRWCHDTLLTTKTLYTVCSTAVTWTDWNAEMYSRKASGDSSS